MPEVLVGSASIRRAAPRSTFAARLLGPLEGQCLLDYGCGMGEEAVYFAKLGAQVTAIDASPIGLEIARKRAVAHGLQDRIQAIVMDAAATTFPDQSFDLIHGLGIIHHIGLDAGF